MPCPCRRAPRRVVSLVPSITEALATTLPGAARRGDRLVHPPGRPCGATGPRHQEPRPQGRSRRSRPDLVVANKEENRELDVRRLRADGIPVWVTDIETVPGALDSLRAAVRRRAATSGRPTGSPPRGASGAGPCPSRAVDVAVAIWRDPWMVVGRDTFTGDLVARLGWRNVLRRRTPTATRTSTSADLDRDGLTSSCCPTSPTSSPPTTAPRRSRTRGPRSSAADCSRGTARVSSGPPRP